MVGLKPAGGQKPWQTMKLSMLLLREDLGLTMATRGNQTFIWA